MPLAYEKIGYDVADAHRLPDRLPEWSVRRLIEAGADVIKVLLYYNAFDDARASTIKHAFVERAGAECAACDVPFFLELVTYDTAIGDVQGLKFARKKPDHVIGAMAEFTAAQYGSDVLKVEVPVNVAFVEGTRAFKGTAAYTRQDALRWFRKAAGVATKPFIYLSGGVTAEVFRESLELAGEAGTNFAGVLYGRANWQNGVPAYASGGPTA